MVVSMMIERHYDEEALMALLETDRAASDTHLLSCTPCAEKLESFQMIADAMRDRDVWDTREVRTEAIPATIATLRAFADRMTAEDAAADLILPELLAGSRETWMGRLHEHPEWRTAGVVRRLLVRAYDAVMTMPPDAVEITAVATEIAEHLDAAAELSDTVARLRGAAWRDHAYALYYTGRFTDAETALRAAERHFSSCAIDSYDLARVGIVKALVMRPFDRIDEAMNAASSSAKTFAAFEDFDRSASARLAEVHLLFSRGDFTTADRILRDLDARLSHTDYADTHARVLGNLGYCSRKLGKLDEAIRFFETSAALHETLGLETEVVRIRWNVAVVLGEAGRAADAMARLRALTPDMERLGMTSEAAWNALELAELLLAESRFEEVDELCRSAMQSFERAGLSYSSRAMTAVAYIREAAQQRVANRALVRKVREYIRQLPAQPNLLFAPSPE
jgi:tetratricopeptide (TPR) repeat protein